MSKPDNRRAPLEPRFDDEPFCCPLCLSVLSDSVELPSAGAATTALMRLRDATSQSPYDEDVDSLVFQGRRSPAGASMGHNAAGAYRTYRRVFDECSKMFRAARKS